MEKSNVINVLVSIGMVFAGLAMLWFAWWNQEEDVAWIIITAIAIILYGIFRIVFTEHETKQ